MANNYMKYAFMTFFIILLGLSLFIVSPFLKAIIASIIVAYIFYPLFKIFNKKIANKNLCALLVIILVLLIVGLFSTLIVTEIIGEVDSLTSEQGLTQLDSAFVQLDSRCKTDTGYTCKSVHYIRSELQNPETKKTIISTISKISANFIVSIPSLLLEMIIFLFTTFYILRDGSRIAKYISDVLPLKKSFKTTLAKKTEDLFYSTIYGAIIVAIIQGSVGVAAFIIFDSTNSPFFWGIIMAISALIPLVGTGIVWLPMGLFQVLRGYTTGSSSVIWKGVGLILVGALIISMLDNILKPKIVGDRAGMHPLLIMLGAFGGLAMIGFIGIFIGPIILAFLMSFLKVYQKEKSDIFKCD